MREQALCVAIVLSLAVNALSAPQAPPAQNDSHAPVASKSDSEDAAYLNYPWQKLRNIVPELDGLKPDSNQDQLAAILARAGQFIADMSPKIPDLISREDVYFLKSDQTRANFFAIGRSISNAEARQLRSSGTQFNYLLLSHRTPEGAVAIEEYRTDTKHRPIEAGSLNPAAHAYGFANQWLQFSTANQGDFQFRYLGRQDKDGHKTFVVAFAQLPERTKVPAKFVSGKNAGIPFYYQGLMWIDQTTASIVLLRTDLLAPLKEAGLKQLTTELHFRSVHIHGMDAVLWLPREVDIQVLRNYDLLLELHYYSDYRLYNVRSRIVLTP